VEEANLLNPAFCCVTLTAFISGYQTLERAGVPFALSFLVLPIILHKSTRETLPRAATTSLAVWIQDNAIARIQFSERLISLRPHTREAIMFGINQKWIVFSAEGTLTTPLSESEIDRRIAKLSNEGRVYPRRAKVVGKWLASAGSAETVMALWGIRP
jgi:hypothetical protein